MAAQCYRTTQTGHFLRHVIFLFCAWTYFRGRGCPKFKAPRLKQARRFTFGVEDFQELLRTQRRRGGELVPFLVSSPCSPTATAQSAPRALLVTSLASHN